MTALLAAVWMLLDYPWGLLTFVAIAALYGFHRGLRCRPERVTFDIRDSFVPQLLQQLLCGLERTANPPARIRWWWAGHSP